MPLPHMGNFGRLQTVHIPSPFFSRIVEIVNERYALRVAALVLNVPKSSLAMSVNSTKGARACVSQLPFPTATCSDVIMRCTLRMCTDRTDRTNRNALCPDVGVCEPLRSPI